MEEIKIENYTVSREVHTFYCDKCNKLIGETRECSDGYIPGIGGYQQRINIPRIGWLTLSKCLCDECAKATTNELVEILKNFGFEKDKY